MNDSQFIQPGEAVMGAETTMSNCIAQPERQNGSSESIFDLLIEESYPPTRTVKEETAEPNKDGGAEANKFKEVGRLASLHPIEYDQLRRVEAKKLGCQVTTLDRLVASTRGGNDADNLQGKASICEDALPWPHVVEGAAILNEVVEVVTRYVWLPKEAADMIALWCAHTHCYSRFYRTPRLNITSPSGNCGKSTLKDIVALCVNRPKPLSGATLATSFRLAHKYKPTLLLDEYDKWLPHNLELVGALNAGWKKGEPIARCEGDNHELREFETFTPVGLFGIGQLPSNLHDRALVVRLERARNSEVKSKWEGPQEEAERQRGLDRKLSRWLKDNLARIPFDPTLPDGVINRQADNWRPLFAIAELAGEDWPHRAQVALNKLTRRDLDPHDFREMVLSDMRELAEERAKSGGRCISSTDIIEHLLDNPERPWQTAGKGGKPINESWLARKLDPLKSERFRDGEWKQHRGYRIADLMETIDRYAFDQASDTEPAPELTEDNADDVQI
jgi:hypothetical protein